MFYDILRHMHSGWRWVVLVFLVYAVINALMKWQGEKAFVESDRKLNFFTVTAAHFQLLFGLILYFISPRVHFDPGMMKDSLVRFFAVEHSILMLIAVVLLTVGNIKSKRRMEDRRKFKTVFWFFLIGLIIILVTIPWPFQKYNAGWF